MAEKAEKVRIARLTDASAKWHNGVGGGKQKVNGGLRAAESRAKAPERAKISRFMVSPKNVRRRATSLDAEALKSLFVEEYGTLALQNDRCANNTHAFWQRCDHLRVKARRL